MTWQTYEVDWKIADASAALPTWLQRALLDFAKYGKQPLQPGRASFTNPPPGWDLRFIDPATGDTHEFTTVVLQKDNRDLVLSVIGWDYSRAVSALHDGGVKTYSPASARAYASSRAAR